MGMARRLFRSRSSMLRFGSIRFHSVESQFDFSLHSIAQFNYFCLSSIRLFPVLIDVDSIRCPTANCTLLYLVPLGRECACALPLADSVVKMVGPLQNIKLFHHRSALFLHAPRFSPSSPFNPPLLPGLCCGRYNGITPSLSKSEIMVKSVRIALFAETKLCVPAAAGTLRRALSQLSYPMIYVTV